MALRARRFRRRQGRARDTARGGGCCPGAAAKQDVGDRGSDRRRARTMVHWLRRNHSAIRSNDGSAWCGSTASACGSRGWRWRRLRPIHLHPGLAHAPTSATRAARDPVAMNAGDSGIKDQPDHLVGGCRPGISEAKSSWKAGTTCADLLLPWRTKSSPGVWCQRCVAPKRRTAGALAGEMAGEWRAGPRWI